MNCPICNSTLKYAKLWYGRYDCDDQNNHSYPSGAKNPP